MGDIEIINLTMLLPIFLILLTISFILALRSMKDFEMPKEVKALLRFRNIRGTILFFKGKKIKHYRS